MTIYVKNVTWNSIILSSTTTYCILNHKTNSLHRPTLFQVEAALYFRLQAKHVAAAHWQPCQINVLSGPDLYQNTGLFHLLFGILFTFHLQYTNRDNNPLAWNLQVFSGPTNLPIKMVEDNHLSRNSDTTISQNSALAICCWSLRTEQTTHKWQVEAAL